MVNTERRRNRLFSGGRNGRRNGYTMIFMSRSNDEHYALNYVRIVEDCTYTVGYDTCCSNGTFCDPTQAPYRNNWPPIQILAVISLSDSS